MRSTKTTVDNQVIHLKRLIVSFQCGRIAEKRKTVATFSPDTLNRMISSLLTACLSVFMFLAFVSVDAHAQAQRRLALVIGNNAYDEIVSLEKAVNDADAVADKLGQIGFEVTLAKDIGRRAMSRAVLEFEKQIQPGDLTLFYYAGHGFSVSGQDFLLPVDIPQAGPGEESMIRDEAFLTNDLADRFLRAGAKTAVLILDACRNNPFERPGTRSIEGSPGLANQPLGEGIFVLYSAGQYQAALDGMGPNDSNPNSVFTRAFLQELGKPQKSIVDIAKATQVAVRDLADRVGHIQLPSYYDQIIGTVTLNNGDASKIQLASVPQDFVEGSSENVLPRGDPAPRPEKGTPLANFMRSNQGWTVTISLPEAATQFGYRVEPEGPFTVTGHMQAIDQRTGLPMPITWFSLPGDYEPGTLYVTWRDARGEEAGVFPITFDPDEALKSGQKQILDQMWTGWVGFARAYPDLIYFSHLISYRCGIEKVQYAYNGSGNFQEWALPDCDPLDPHRVPNDVAIHSTMPAGTETVQVILTYYDGSESVERNFNIKNASN